MMTDVLKKEAPSMFLSSIKLMVLRALPFTAKRYAQSLRKLMDGISDESFKYYSSYFAGMVKLTKRGSQRFRNSSRETDYVLQEFPRLKQHRSLTLGFVRVHRQKCKLPI